MNNLMSGERMFEIDYTLGCSGRRATAPRAGPNLIGGPDVPKGTCSIDGCDRPARSRGWCPLHYGRWKRRGDPLVSRVYSYSDGVTAEERFWDKVDKGTDPDACWLWTAYVSPDGYGWCGYGERSHGAHRLSWLFAHGDWPTEQVDHQCHNRSGCMLTNDCPHRRCVRPDHLEDVPHAVNMLRGNTIAAVNALKTHCSKGHLLEAANIYADKKGRVCRICNVERAREWRRKRRAG